MLNNAHIIRQLTRHLQDTSESSESAMLSVLMREHIRPEPCMLARLPTSAFMEREAESLAPRAIIKQLRRSPSPSPPSSVDETQRGAPTSPRLSPVSEDETPPRARTMSITSVLSSISMPSPKLSVRGRPGAQPKGWKEPESFEIFRAVEKKDIMFLMEVRDKAFHLLLRKNGDATPLLHAMRIGKSHQDVAIVLLGAFSRYINSLTDDDFNLPSTKTLLRALRVNLRAAIDFGLQTQQSDLIASFLQTLIMSEGESWVVAQVGNVAAVLRAGTGQKPVKTAEDAVRDFATSRLGRAGMIASFEDYVANATADSVMMAAWSCALAAGVEGEPIPTWYFARDDRVFRVFVERVDQHKGDINRHCGKRLRWQLRVLRKAMDGRATSWHQKVQVLAEEFDNSEDVRYHHSQTLGS